ncbi:MAG: LysR substrate-binding domain-containing protein [Aeromonas sp.]
MKLQQLKYLLAIKDHHLNISAAAEALYTSQPGMSKQVGLLENELGVRIFERRGKHLHSLTPVGRAIIDNAASMVNLEHKIKALAREHLDPTVGSLNIYTTHTIARYLLPRTVRYFTQQHPKISFHLHPLPAHNHDPLPKGYADFSIVAHQVAPDKELICLPAYLWTLSLVVPPAHPLAECREVRLEQLADYPILTYEQGARGREVLDAAFAAQGLTPHYYMTVMDAGVIKRYVELGFGIGVIASLAANDVDGCELVTIKLEHLLAPCPAHICFSKSLLLQNYMYDFLHSFAPHLTRVRLEPLMQAPHQARLASWLEDVSLPIY